MGTRKKDREELEEHREKDKDHTISPAKEGRNTSEFVINELLEIVKEKQKIAREVRAEKKVGVEEQSELSRPLVPSGEILDQILQEGLDTGDVKCNNMGKCNDGKNIGEIFVDKYGFKRQRGFVNTTRFPVFLDWIVEEAEVQKILPRAYSVRTNRGSLALIPEDFLCELHTRYGVILKNYDKCRNYRSIIGREAQRSRRKRR